MKLIGIQRHYMKSCDAYTKQQMKLIGIQRHYMKSCEVYKKQPVCTMYA